jgi:hypothetical protein
MIEDYSVKRKIKRFSEKIAVVEKGGISVQVAENELYADAYKKLFRFIEKSGAEKLSVTVSYLDKDVISFLCRFENTTLPLNYSVSSGFFERDSQVLKKRGITKREVTRTLKKIQGECAKKSPCTFFISDGVGLLLAPYGEKCVKIRHK